MTSRVRVERRWNCTDVSHLGPDRGPDRADGPRSVRTLFLQHTRDAVRCAALGNVPRPFRVGSATSSDGPFYHADTDDTVPALPTSRATAAALLTDLDSALAALGPAPEVVPLLAVLDGALAAATRQVLVHCAERGVLVEFCRVTLFACLNRILQRNEALEARHAGMAAARAEAEAEAASLREELATMRAQVRDMKRAEDRRRQRDSAGAAENARALLRKLNDEQESDQKGTAQARLLERRYRVAMTDNADREALHGRYLTALQDIQALQNTVAERDAEVAAFQAKSQPGDAKGTTDARSAADAESSVTCSGTTGALDAHVPAPPPQSDAARAPRRSAPGSVSDVANVAAPAEPRGTEADSAVRGPEDAVELAEGPEASEVEASGSRRPSAGGTPSAAGDEPGSPSTPGPEPSASAWASGETQTDALAVDSAAVQTDMPEADAVATCDLGTQTGTEAHTAEAHAAEAMVEEPRKGSEPSTDAHEESVARSDAPPLTAFDAMLARLSLTQWKPRGRKWLLHHVDTVYAFLREREPVVRPELDVPSLAVKCFQTRFGLANLADGYTADFVMNAKRILAECRRLRAFSCFVGLAHFMDIAGADAATHRRSDLPHYLHLFRAVRRSLPRPALKKFDEEGALELPARGVQNFLDAVYGKRVTAAGMLRLRAALNDSRSDGAPQLRLADGILDGTAVQHSWDADLLIGTLAASTDGAVGELVAEAGGDAADPEQWADV